MSQDHSISMRTYVAVFVALLVLTATTVGAAFIDMGRPNDVIAMGIAGTKATLVLLYFTHVRYSTAFTREFLGAALW